MTQNEIEAGNKVKNYLVCFKNGKEITVTESVIKPLIEGVNTNASFTVVDAAETGEILLVINPKEIVYMHVIKSV